MIAYDKGISDIVENNYYEELGIVVTQGDYTLTLQSVVADYSGMTIFYKLESPFDLSEVSITSLEVSQQGIPLGVASSYISSLDRMKRLYVKTKLKLCLSMNYRMTI